MSAPRKFVEFGKRIFLDRLGDPYEYGGSWDPFNVKQGDDCSHLVTAELGAVFYGTAMSWSLELTTEAYRYRDLGPQKVGPFDLVHVASPGDVPADAVMRIDLHHEGAGGPQSHMHCVLDGVVMESNDDHGTCTLPKAIDPSSSYWNDWWYVPGPIVEDGTPREDLSALSQPTDTLFADVSEFQTVVTNAYTDAGYRWLSIRSNDGTHRDIHFAANYAWAKAAADAGLITGFMVYYYWRPNETGLATHMAMVNEQGGPHPRMVSMIDLESGGNPGGDQSNTVNDEYHKLQAWLGDDRRVIGYANLSDERSMWQFKPAHVPMILAGYGNNPSDPNVFKIAHQYTDGNGYGGGLPEGAPPFGNCDMNSADGFSPTQLADALGVGGTTTGGISMADAQSLSNDFAGVDGNSKSLPWRIVNLLRPGKPRDLSTVTDGTAEGPNTSTSVFDQVATLSKILTRTYNGNDLWDMVCDIHDAVVKPPTK